jgi:hypothetical protein
MVWMSMTSEKDPTEWDGSRNKMKDKNTAPDKLLKIIYCKLLREMQIPCTAACGPGCSIATIQTILKRLIRKKRRRSMILKTELTMYFEYIGTYLKLDLRRKMGTVDCQKT